MLRKSRIPLIAAAIITLSAGAVAADRLLDGQGEVDASSYTPVPKTETLALRPMEDTGYNMRVGKTLVAALEQRGWKVGEDGPIYLMFDASAPGLDLAPPTSQRGGAPEGITRATGNPALGEPGKVTSSSVPGSVPEELRTSSETRGRPQINIQIGPPTGAGGESALLAKGRHRVNVVVARKGGDKLWEGTAIGVQYYGDPVAVGDRLAEVLASYFGESVTGHKFDLNVK